MAKQKTFWLFRPFGTTLFAYLIMLIFAMSYDIDFTFASLQTTMVVYEALTLFIFVVALATLIAVAGFVFTYKKSTLEHTYVVTMWLEFIILYLYMQQF